MDSRCRLCAECFAFLIPILEDLDFCSKIFQLFQIRVAVGDSLPIAVCQQCYNMVEKTWHFNDRIQKAQEILAGLIPNISVIATGEPLAVEHAVDGNVLDGKNEILINTEMVELTYIDGKEIKIAGSEFFNEEMEATSDESDRSEPKRKVNRVKSKVGKLLNLKYIILKSKFCFYILNFYMFSNTLGLN